MIAYWNDEVNCAADAVGGRACDSEIVLGSLFVIDRRKCGKDKDVAHYLKGMFACGGRYNGIFGVGDGAVAGKNAGEFGDEYSGAPRPLHNWSRRLIVGRGEVGIGDNDERLRDGSGWGGGNWFG